VSHINIQTLKMTMIRKRARLVQNLREQGIVSEEILHAFQEIPRHLFVEEAIAHQAYENNSLPIGQAQTISQPYIVAKMTELLMSGRAMTRVLEIGTGSGFQTAILAELVSDVYSVERIESLHTRASQRLLELFAFDNIKLTLSDGNLGWSEHAPFSGIMVTAAPEYIPDALLQQLSRDNGRLVAPVGGDQQVLKVITRTGDKFVTEIIEPVAFVPFLTGIQTL
jgi:protein-L-isoaspartate(D-aspartate) O-methyltransferase